METVRKRQSVSGGVIGIPTGYAEFDRMTTGLNPGDLVIIAARPSMGKTALALNIAVNAASSGHGVGIYSLEMASELLGERIIARAGRISSGGIRNGTLSPDDYDKMVETAAKTTKWPIYVDDTSYLTITDLRIRAGRMCAKHKIGLLIVDYLQLMDGRHGSKRQEQVAEISRGLKTLAGSLGIPILALSQLNRSLESRANKRPMLSDLRESGAIEQDADTIVFIYRDEVYNRRDDNPNKGFADIIIAKQRNGPTGEFRLIFDPDYSTFADLYLDDHQPAAMSGSRDPEQGGLPWKS
jgi:replicative DNA helicase